MDLIEAQADILVQKVKHYLITAMGRTLDEANDEEFYLSLCWALREEIMVNWTSTNHTLINSKVRKLYYISMEYMPGRLLVNNVNNIRHSDLVKCLIKKLGKESSTVYNMEPEIGIGNGGLGRLASCFMDSLATQKYPALGYGMRYQYGIFEQELWCGVQVERPDCWLLHDSPWSFRRDVHAFNVHFGGRSIRGVNKHNEEIFEALLAPPTEELQDLYDSAKKGQIVAVRQYIAKLEQSGKEYGPFAAALRPYAKGFNLKQLCEFLESYVEETA